MPAGHAFAPLAGREEPTQREQEILDILSRFSSGAWGIHSRVKDVENIGERLTALETKVESIHQTLTILQAAQSAISQQLQAVVGSVTAIHSQMVRRDDPRPPEPVGPSPASQDMEASFGQRPGGSSSAPRRA